MDRTSILGDTIDYVKDLKEQIKTLKGEIGTTPGELNLLNPAKNFSSGINEEMMPMRNPIKVRSFLRRECRHKFIRQMATY
jgi:hypothetical protein